MSPQSSAAFTTFLVEELRVGDPEVAGPLTVFPLFGPPPRASYLAFSDALEHGARIRELDGHASVNDLIVDNPTQHSVLLFEGEELAGAQQDRTLDVSVLVAAGATLHVPVSCVEAGRWDGRRHGELFEPSPHAAYPRLRREKAAQARVAAQARRPARAVQSNVWSELADRAELEGAESETGAMRDIFANRAQRVDEICEDIPRVDGQLGAIAAYAGQLQVLDFVSQPAAYSALYDRLLRGYALDSLDGEDSATPERSAARQFALLACGSIPEQRPAGLGLGEDARFSANRVAGSGLVLDRELIQLTAFPDTDADSGGGVARPSTRRTALSLGHRLKRNSENQAAEHER